MLLLKLIQSFFKTLHSEGTPGQVAAGLVLGSILGLTPLLSLHNVVVVGLIVILNVWIPGAMPGWALRSLPGSCSFYGAGCAGRRPDNSITNDGLNKPRTAGKPKVSLACGPQTVRRLAMRGRLMFGAGTLAAVLAVGSCKDDVGLTSIPPAPERFVAVLSGANEPTPTTTAAQGLATITVNGNVLSYRVELSNIDSAFLAHIHHNVAGLNGPVRVNLYVPPLVATDVHFSGLLIEDTVTVADSILTFMRGGAGYVNVHTKLNPGGEIRGQLFRFQ